jgi:hypothetical protein
MSSEKVRYEAKHFVYLFRKLQQKSCETGCVSLNFHMEAKKISNEKGTPYSAHELEFTKNIFELPQDRLRKQHPARKFLCLKKTKIYCG